MAHFIGGLVPDGIQRMLGGWNAAPGRAIAVRSSDVFLTSYPRSGNTWLRFLVANVIWGTSPVDFATIEQQVPDIYQNPAAQLARLSSPRLLKSHEYLDPRYPKVVYMVRDPREVAVSYYYYEMKQGRLTEAYGISRFVGDFLDGSISKFGSWGDHVGGWLGARAEDPRFLMVHYERLRREPRTELAEICRFLGVDADRIDLGRAVDASALDRMRELEKRTGEGWAPLRFSRSDIPFIRDGATDAGQAVLTQEDRGRIVDKWPKLLEGLGYLESHS